MKTLFGQSTFSFVQKILLEIPNQWTDKSVIVQKGFSALPTDQLRHRWQNNEARKSKQGVNYGQRRYA
jgi:hypothetical protein